MSSKLIIETTDIADLMIIHPFVTEDLRGSFIKDFSQEVFNENGFDFNIQEVFYTKSIKGVIRALHFQEKIEQAKLIRCIKGEIFDVVVDLRFGSLTFGKWRSFNLSEYNHVQVLVPKGFAHGYFVIEDAVVSYKCDEKFYPEFDSGIIWNDKEINIDWPLHLIDKIIISDRDRNLITFSEFKMLNGNK
jgi:dTDP-4-dehydrorhamnose 3,5-epimerase